MDGQTALAADAVSPGAAAPAPSALASPAACLIVNPKSFTAARRSLAQRAAELARARGVEVIGVADAADMAGALDRIAHRPPQTLFLLGGDGTVQAIVDRLAALPASAPKPPLFILAGGRSNLTAADLGGRGAVLQQLDAALERSRQGSALAVQTREVLCIEQSPAPARHGFFLAAGLVDYAIRACHRYRENTGSALRSGDAGTTWNLVRIALPAMLGVREPALDDLRVEVPGREALTQPGRWFMATTLQRRQGLIDPYAQRGEGPIRFTAVAARGIGLWARLPWLASGRFTDAMTAGRGDLSGRCEALRLTGLSSYTLDGEEFAADPARPVSIRPGPSLTFLTL
jgi:hypothetical protein